MDKTQRSAVLHAVFVTLVLAALARGLMAIPWLEGFRSFCFAILAIYLPLWLVKYQGWSLDFVERSWSHVARSLCTGLAVAAIIFPLYYIVADTWLTQVWDLNARPFLRHWTGWNYLMTQLILVAMPEEFFFRGYLHRVLDRALGRPWRLFGAQLGWGWIIASLLFAASHTIALFQWWHFAIFFPGLMFGYLHARTGGLLASILFHGLSNYAMWWLATNYA